MTFSPFSNNCWPAKGEVTHDNPDGPCECGAMHLLSRDTDRKNFPAHMIRKAVLKKIQRYEEEIESAFSEIRAWMEVLEDPP